MKKIRWGVVGAGGIAHRRTLPVIGEVKNGTLSVVMDIKDPEKLGKLYGCAWTDDLQAAVSRDDVDAVYVAGPVHLHAEHAIAAAKAGKHVLCEKPLARTVAEAKTVVDACAANRVLLREAYMLRQHGAHKEMLRLIQQGAVGKIVFAQIHWAFLYPKMEGAWRQIPELGGGGSLADVGCHSFDILEMMVGPIKRVAAVTGTVIQDYKVDDLATVLLEFESGAQGAITTSFCLSGNVMPPSLSIYGSAGALLATDTLTQGTGGDLLLVTEPDGARRPVEYTQVNMYVRQLEAFADAVMAGERTTPDKAAGLLRVMRMLEGSYASSRDGRFVTI
ncbi:MAG: Gfo/Idh/MocA family protein [Armatimonadota bacterium]